MREIDQSDASETVKVLNLRKALRQTVTDESQSKPFLTSIGERAETITAAYENRQLSTQDVLARFIELAEKYARAARERDRLGLDENAFAVYTVLKDVMKDVTPEQARAVNQVFTRFPDYQWNSHQESALRMRLYSTLKPTVGTENLIETTNKLLKLERVK